MKKLAVLSSDPMVQALMRRLEEASIAAFCSSERSVMETYLGGEVSVSVWIRDEVDLPRAAELLREVRAEASHRHCPRCGYDLGGHAGPTRCPECGRDLTAPAPDVACPACGEAVPAGFEICWSCGAALRPPGAGR